MEAPDNLIQLEEDRMLAFIGFGAVNHVVTLNDDLSCSAGCRLTGPPQQLQNLPMCGTCVSFAKRRLSEVSAKFAAANGSLSLELTHLQTIYVEMILSAASRFPLRLSRLRGEVPPADEDELLNSQFRGARERIDSVISAADKGNRKPKRLNVLALDLLLPEAEEALRSHYYAYGWTQVLIKPRRLFTDTHFKLTVSDVRLVK